MGLTLDDIDLADEPDLCGEQMLWVDEWEWDPIEQDQKRGLTGSMIIQEGVKLYGRPITLSSEGGAWFRLSKVQQLKALAEVPEKVMMLTLPTGATHYVAFNRVNGPAVEAQPVFRRVDPGPDYEHELTLRLITVAPPAPPPEPDPEP
jgi:hypothetical protein